MKKEIGNSNSSVILENMARMENVKSSMGDDDLGELFGSQHKTNGTNQSLADVQVQNEPKAYFRKERINSKNFLQSSELKEKRNNNEGFLGPAGLKKLKKTITSLEDAAAILPNCVGRRSDLGLGHGWLNNTESKNCSGE